MTNIDPVTPGLVAPVNPEAPRALGGGTGNASFQRLLENLEGLARAPAAKVTDAEDLQHAMRRADDEFVTAMDLRRRLLDAMRGGG